jgi:hypothetical protein
MNLESLGNCTWNAFVSCFVVIDIQTHGLPPALIGPIAAADLEAIETYVSTIRTRIPGRKRPTNAVVTHRLDFGRPRDAAVRESL